MHIARLAAASTAIVLASAAVAADAPQSIALHCPRLLDVDAGKLLGATTVVIEGARIKQVRGGHVEVAGAKTIDLQDVTCLPGLIDSHTHLTDETRPTQY